MSSWSLVLALSATVAGGACGRYGFADPEHDARTPPVTDDATPSTDGGVDGGGGCAGRHGPAMVRVPGGYCIDKTEVTKAQYMEFMSAQSIVPFDEPCAFNTTYQPVSYVWNATLDPQQAVAGADWCDARDYCAWAGKRLCGRIGGGSLAYAEHAEPSSQWYFACSQGGQRRHPYGTASDDEAKPGYCFLDDGDTTTGRQAVVGSYPQCELLGTGVVDLLGNLQEWVDACEPGGAPEAQLCKVVGGVWYFGSSYTDCRFFDPSGGNGIRRDATEKHIGFRCCAD